MDAEELTIYRVWLISCDRCANEDTTEWPSEAGARESFTRMGWGFHNDRQMCPACNGVGP